MEKADKLTITERLEKAMSTGDKGVHGICCVGTCGHLPGGLGHKWILVAALAEWLLCQAPGDTHTHI